MYDPEEPPGPVPRPDPEPGLDCRIAGNRRYRQSENKLYQPTMSKRYFISINRMGAEYGAEK
jgi:hypothetical protein